MLVDIRQSRLFQLQAGQLRKEIPRFDDILDAATWAVIHHGERFGRCPGTNLHILETREFSPFLPGLLVLFTIEADGYATLRSIEIEPAE